ncbi:MAG: M28 family peptidase [Candidatus Omnitrophota bacterium]
MLRLIFIAAATAVIVKFTTFGWQGLCRAPEFSLRDNSLPDRLKGHVFKLSEEIGERSIFRYSRLTEAADYIAGQFRDFGLSVKFQEYLLYGKKVKNIIAEKTGGKKPEEIIIIGAHYDTCFNPGADDNASAVAGLLELARLTSPSEFNRTIRFVAFVNEEPPFFKTKDMGSYVYARRAREEGENIKAAIILEMIGYYSGKLFSQRYPIFLGLFYPNRANFIAVVGNSANRGLVKKINTCFKNNSRFIIRSAVLFDFVPGVDFSDHWSFWQNGFPAAMITDTSFYRYSYYHGNSDTYEKLDYRSAAAVIEGLKPVLSSLAE